MGQGLSSKDSIPAHQLEYSHRDEYGNAQKFTRTLSHNERYKIHSKADGRGKITMGIHRTLFHHTSAKTVGKGHTVNRGKGGVGAFKNYGDTTDKYGRPLTALELLKKAENDRKLEAVRMERKKREEMYQSVNNKYSNIKLNASQQKAEGDEPALAAFNRQQAILEAKQGLQGKAKSAGRAGMRALEQRIAERQRQHQQEEESKKPPVTNTFSNLNNAGVKTSPIQRRRYWNSRNDSNTDGAGDQNAGDGVGERRSSSPYVLDSGQFASEQQRRPLAAPLKLPARARPRSADRQQQSHQSIGDRFRQLQRSQSQTAATYGEHDYNSTSYDSGYAEESSQSSESAQSRAYRRRNERRNGVGAIDAAVGSHYNAQIAAAENVANAAEGQGPNVRARVAALPHGWVQYWDPNEQKHYYYHAVSKKSQWEVPAPVAKLDTYKNASFRRKRFKLLCEIGAWNSMNVKGQQLKVRRRDMMEDSYNHIMRMDYNNLKAKMRIVYEGETGIDSGGLTKDWYLEISRRLLSKESQLCLFLESTNNVYVIDQRSKIANPDYIRYYRCYGRLLAKAIFDRQVMDAPLCSALWKRIIGKIPDLEDVKEIDNVYYTSLKWILENDITDVVDETFSVMREEFGAYVVVDLVPGGREIAVTNDNKELYVQAVVDYVCGGSVEDQLAAIANGVYELVPKTTLIKFTAAEIKELVNGKDVVDINELREGVRYTGGFENGEHKTLECFWKAMESFSNQTREQVLRFVTGTSKVPLDGFDPPLTITRTEEPIETLPTAHTCFNQLVLPEYQSIDLLVEKLMYGVKHADGFHLS